MRMPSLNESELLEVGPFEIFDNNLDCNSSIRLLSCKELPKTDVVFLIIDLITKHKTIVETEKGKLFGWDILTELGLLVSNGSLSGSDSISRFHFF